MGLFLYSLIFVVALKTTYSNSLSAVWVLASWSVAVASALLYGELFVEWLFRKETSVPAIRYFMRPIVTRYFHKTFYAYPPRDKDYKSMKLLQDVVDETLDRLRKNLGPYDTFIREENKRIEEMHVKSEPLGAAQLVVFCNDHLARVEEHVARLKAAKVAYDNAEWVATFFHFALPEHLVGLYERLGK
jgi:hypothetical protein